MSDTVTIRRNADEGRGDLVSTKEAAEILGVERPRLKRWSEMGIMPPLVDRVAAGPLWLRVEIEALRDERAKGAAVGA